MDPFCYLCFKFVIIMLRSLGKDWPLGSFVFDVFCVFVTFPHGVSGQVRYLIVSIPDLCLFYFKV